MSLIDVWHEGYVAAMDGLGTGVCPYQGVNQKNEIDWWMDGYKCAIEENSFPEFIASVTRTLAVSILGQSGHKVIIQCDDDQTSVYSARAAIRSHIRDGRLTRAEGTQLIIRLAKQRIT